MTTVASIYREAAGEREPKIGHCGALRSIIESSVELHGSYRALRQALDRAIEEHGRDWVVAAMRRQALMWLDLYTSLYVAAEAHRRLERCYV